MRRTLFIIVAALFGCSPLKASVGDPESSPLQKKFANNPNDRTTNMQLGSESEASGDFLRAEQYYLRAEALGVSSDEIVPRILRVLVSARRYDEALERCHLRLETKPEDRATRYVTAAILQALDRPKEAERELDTLIRTKPDDADAYLALAQLYRDSYRDRPRARPLFERYLKLAPTGQSAGQVRFQLDEDAAQPPDLPPVKKDLP